MIAMIKIKDKNAEEKSQLVNGSVSMTSDDESCALPSTKLDCNQHENLNHIKHGIFCIIALNVRIFRIESLTYLASSSSNARSLLFGAKETFFTDSLNYKFSLEGDDNVTFLPPFSISDARENYSRKG